MKAMFVLLNGKFEDASKAKVSVADNGFLYGDGVYETLRTYGGRIWQVEVHLKRLRSSARMLKIEVPWPDAKMDSWLKKLCRLNGFKETRIRISVTRGVNGMDFVGSRKPTILIQAAELKEVPSSAKKNGVDAVTVRFQRLLPEAKTISLLPMILARQAADKAKAYEALFVDGKGFVLEGTVTNVFMVKNGKVFTPGKDVLPGTTAEALMKALKGCGVAVVKRGIRLSELKKADEVFLTNAPRGIIPVRKVDGAKIGAGKPGPMIVKITRIFKDYICRNI